MTLRRVSRDGLVVRGARQLPPDATELICQFTAMYIEDDDRIPPELLWLSRTLGRLVLPPQYCRGYEVLVHVEELKLLIPRGPQCRPLVRGELDDEQQVRRGMKMPTGTTCGYRQAMSRGTSWSAGWRTSGGRGRTWPMDPSLGAGTG